MLGACPLQPRKGAPDSPSLTSEPPKQLMAKEQPQTSFLPTGALGRPVHQHRHAAPHTHPQTQPFTQTKTEMWPYLHTDKGSPWAQPQPCSQPPRHRLDLRLSPTRVPAPRLMRQQDLAKPGLSFLKETFCLSLLGILKIQAPSLGTTSSSKQCHQGSLPVALCPGNYASGGEDEGNGWGCGVPGPRG